MKNTLRKIYVLLFACSAFLLNSCGELVDCIAPAKANLHSKALTNGIVGSNYNNFIEADVTNEPNDDEYDYFFSLSGNLPPGMTYHEQGRKVYFSGVPTQAGSYSFKIRLTIDPKYGYHDQTCFGDDTTTKEYTLVIN